MFTNIAEQKGGRRYHSQPRKRTTKASSKRQKVQLLKHKFKKALNNITQLKHQNYEDYNHLKQLMINSERIEKIAHESRQKTKLLISDSLQAKRRNTMPSVLDSQRVTPFQLTNSTQYRKISTEEDTVPEKRQRSHHKQQKLKIKQKHRKEEQIDKICGANTQKIQELSVQNQNSEHRIDDFSPKKSQCFNFVQKNNSQLKNSICFRSTRLKQSTVSIGKKKVAKQGIKPYIMALVFSIFLLVLLKL